MTSNCWGQTETTARRNSPVMFHGTSQEEMKFTITHTSLRLQHVVRVGAGTPLKEFYGTPATSQKIKYSLASPQTSH